MSEQQRTQTSGGTEPNGTEAPATSSVTLSTPDEATVASRPATYPENGDVNPLQQQLRTLPYFENARTNGTDAEPITAELARAALADVRATLGETWETTEIRRMDSEAVTTQLALEVLHEVQMGLGEQIEGNNRLEGHKALCLLRHTRCHAEILEQIQGSPAITERDSIICQSASHLLEALMNMYRDLAKSIMEQEE